MFAVPLQSFFKEMAQSLCCSSFLSVNTTQKPGLISHKYTSRNANWITDTTYSSNNVNFDALKVNATEKNPAAKATEKTPATKTTSLLCPDCEGNGAKQCGQCEGGGINIVDHYEGRFKAGASCWLCRGKREVLCGSCNGAGFLGGFMSTLED